MKIINDRINLDSKGDGDLINITDEVSGIVASSGIKKGQVTVFVVGSTAAVTTFEYEPGLIRDVRELCDDIVPRKASYHHDAAWGDANGFSHLRAALFGPSLVVPVISGAMALGTWQQIILIDFDTRARNRTVVCQILS